MQGAVLDGRYHLEDSLGEGGMGRVYEATDQQLGRRVAIKLIREELTDPATRERFMREARAAAALTHPNACRLYEVGEHEGQPFLVMELLHGESLSGRLARGHLPVEEAAALILPLLSALSALHHAGLIHRDLKPSNVFLTPDGVKLLDFGLARYMRSETALTAPTLTAHGAVTGTLRYMAPEQVTGDPVDERTDIFALGVMLYETLTGRIPFDATTNVDWLNAVLKQDPAPLGGAELRSLEPIVGRALQRRPDDRYQSVDEMSLALQEAFGDSSKSGERTEEQTPSLVVLPFQAHVEDPEVGFLQNSVPEALTTALSVNPVLRVLSNRAALHFDGKAELATIGRELGADRMLTGTFLRSGNIVRVTAQLVSAVDGSVQWSHTSQHEFEDALMLQDQICAEILNNLPDDVYAAGTAPSSAVPTDHT